MYLADSPQQRPASETKSAGQASDSEEMVAETQSEVLGQAQPNEDLESFPPGIGGTNSPGTQSRSSWELHRGSGSPNTEAGKLQHDSGPSREQVGFPQFGRVHEGSKKGISASKRVPSDQQEVVSRPHLTGGNPLAPPFPADSRSQGPSTMGSWVPAGGHLQQRPGYPPHPSTPERASQRGRGLSGNGSGSGFGRQGTFQGNHHVVPLHQQNLPQGQSIPYGSHQQVPPQPQACVNGQPQCPNDVLGRNEYIPCLCTPCCQRNRSIFVLVRRKPSDMASMDLKSCIKKGLQKRFGNVQEVSGPGGREYMMVR